MIRVADQPNADVYTKMGEAFLGTYFEPTENYVLDFEEGQDADETDQRTAAGTPRPILRNRTEAFDLPYRVLGAADRTSFTTMFEAVKNRSDVQSKPFFFTPDSATPADTVMVYWVGALRFLRVSSSFSDLTVRLEERPLSAF